MSQTQVGCAVGNKILEELVNCKSEYEEPCCYEKECCEGIDCDCCNEDGNKSMGHCDCMLSDDEYYEYLKNREQVKKLDKKFRDHQERCKECQV